MAMNLNKVMIAGNMTRDVEVRYTGSGVAVGNMGLAINRRFKRGDELAEETTFVDVTLWNKDAENAQQYLAKGSGVLIEGRLTLEEWDDKETGKKRSKLTVTCERLHFASKGGDTSGNDRQDGGESRGRQRGQASDQSGRRHVDDTGAKPGPFNPPDDGSDDVPF